MNTEAASSVSELIETWRRRSVPGSMSGNTLLRCADELDAALARLSEVPPTPAQDGTWAKDDPRRIFVEGAKWWEWQQTGATMFPSDRDRCEREAGERYPALAARVPPPEKEPITVHDFVCAVGEMTNADALARVKALVRESDRALALSGVPVTPKQEPTTMTDAAEMLWLVLANVSGGDWTKQTLEWQEVAARWRNNYFAALAARVPPPEKETTCTPVP